MLTYTQMMFNATNRKNPVNVIWEGGVQIGIQLMMGGHLYDENHVQMEYTGNRNLDNMVDDEGDEGFTTYDEARAWVQEYLIDDKRYDVSKWKIVDDVTNKIIESNYDDVKNEEDFMRANGEGDDFDLTYWFDEDEELVAEYEELLEEKRIEEILMNIAISKIRRNAIYNLGLGLKLSMKSYFNKSS